MSETGQIEFPQRPRPRVNLRARLFAQTIQQLTTKNKIQEDRKKFIESKRVTSHSSNVPEVKSSDVSKKPAEVTSSHINNSNDLPFQSSLVDKSSLGHNERKSFKSFHNENVDLKTKCENNVFEKKVSTNVPTLIHFNEPKQLSQSKSLLSKYQSAFVRNTIKYDSNKNHYSRQDIKEKRSDIPNLDFEKGQRHICDNRDNWGDEDCIKDYKPIQSNQLKSHAQFISVGSSKKDDLNQTNNAEPGRQDVKEERCGWPNSGIEKDSRYSCDNEGGWDDNDCSRENEKRKTEHKERFQRSASMPYSQSKSSIGSKHHLQEKENSWSDYKPVGNNAVACKSQIKDDSSKTINTEQDIRPDLKQEECGWPKLDVEKDRRHSYDNGGGWDDDDCSGRNERMQTEEKKRSYHRSSSTPYSQSKCISESRHQLQEKENHWTDNSSAGNTAIICKSNIKDESSKTINTEQDTRLDLKQEECGWPPLDVEKDRRHSYDNGDGWDDVDCSRAGKRMESEDKNSFQCSVSTPYSQSKCVNQSRHDEEENNLSDNRSEVQNNAIACKVVRSNQGVPNNSFRSKSFNRDGSGDCSGTFPNRGYKNGSSGRNKWNDSQPYQPKSQLTRSKSLRGRTKYGKEVSRTSNTLVKNRSFVNSQDSVHNAADSDSDSCADLYGMARKSIKNFTFREESSFAKTRSQDRKTKVDSHNELLNTHSAEWDKAWRNKIYNSRQVKDTKTCEEKPISCYDADLEISSSSLYRDHNSSDLWSTVSENSDASVIELENCDTFKTHHTVVPSKHKDPLTGLPSLKITCKFVDNAIKCESLSDAPQVKQKSSACKSPDTLLLNSIVDYSDPVEEFFQNCCLSDIPPPHPVNDSVLDNPASPPVTAVSNGSSESMVRLSSETSDYNSISDLALEDSPAANKVLEHLPDARQISEITSFLKEMEDEKSMPTNIANKIVEDVRKVMRYSSIKGYQVHLYGSYLSGLAVSTSNLNLALAYPDSNPKNSFLLQLQKEFLRRLPDYFVDPFEDDKNPKKSKICFTERDSGVSCELVYYGTNASNYRKISCLLQDVCHYDERIKTLLIGTRIWAEVCLINEPEEGKLHSLGFSLLMLHFLQKLDKPLLPVIELLSKDWVLKPVETKNDSSVGELWLEFLKYFSYEFNWEHNVVTIHSETTVLKSSKSWERSFIAIEDPFTQKNIGDSVESQDCAECIKSCFKSSYEYFLLPAENDDSDASESDGQNGISKKGTYSFNNIPFDQYLPSFCEDCDELDELCGKCKPTKETTSKSIVEPLTKLSKQSLACVNTALHDVFEQYILPKNNVEGRKAFVEYLENIVKKIYRSAKLTLFGSSVNGFGFKRSDLDICMTLDRKPVSDAEKSRILGSIVRHLRKSPNLFKNVFGLYYAQIPIIKFKYVPEEFHCDLSLYNVLGVHNSSLLCKYALMDERCRIIGCALKLLAKKACINDTVCHTLSSYSYILMAIHYLQQVEPPVLPVIPIDDKKVFEENLGVPREVLKDRNYWFSENVDELKKRYMPQSMNNLSVGELWQGLIDFLTRYDGTNAFTITQKEPLPSASLQRCARLFNIEDPFLVKRNLGCILNDAGVATTLRVLGRARFLFGKEIPEEWHSDPKKYLFSSSNLTGQYIKEMECLSCGGFGHEKPDCEKDNPFKRSQMFKKPRIPYKPYPYKHKL